MPKTVWQCAGATMSMNNACATYGVTEQDCKNAKLECQWRSTYGNSYPVLKCEDVKALRKKLDLEKAQKYEQEMIAKYGEEVYNRMKQEKEAKKQAEAKAKKYAAERASNVLKISNSMMTVLKLQKEFSVAKPPDIDGITVAKTAAKTDWFLSSDTIEKLECVTEGRTKKYKLVDLIRQSEKSHGYHPSLKSKLEKRRSNNKNHHTLAQYVAYQTNKAKVDWEPADFAKEARTKILKTLDTEFQKAKAQLEETKTRFRAFSELTADVAEGNKENDHPTSPKKKLKLEDK